jgi:hypothetical protein
VRVVTVSCTVHQEGVYSFTHDFFCIFKYSSFVHVKRAHSREDDEDSEEEKDLERARFT